MKLSLSRCACELWHHLMVFTKSVLNRRMVEIVSVALLLIFSIIWWIALKSLMLEWKYLYVNSTLLLIQLIELGEVVLNKAIVYGVQHQKCVAGYHLGSFSSDENEKCTRMWRSIVSTTPLISTHIGSNVASSGVDFSLTSLSAITNTSLYT